MNNNFVTEAYDSVYKFNKIAGNFPDELNNQHVGIDNQLSYVFEELTETINAFETHDDKELLDGVADVFVTVAGLMQKLEHAGYNVSEALKRVTDNNLTKFIESGTIILDLPPNWTQTTNYEYDVDVIKDENGKIRKCSHYKPVDLTGCYPAGYLLEASEAKEAQ